MRYYSRMFSAFVIALLLSTGFVAAQGHVIDVAPRMAPMQMAPMPDLSVSPSINSYDTRNYDIQQAPSAVQPSCSYDRGSSNPC